MELGGVIAKNLVLAGFKLLSQPEIQQQLFDFLQESSGNVNRDDLEKAIKKTCSTCTRKNIDEQLRVTAFVTALYMQNDIKRAAQVGGSLRKRFGVTWFPHIKERELRYALDVDKELEEYLYQQLVKNK